jgi:hypothetical protein
MGSPNDILAPSGALVAINVTPTTPYLLLAGSRQLFAMGIYANGAQQDISPQVTWSATSVSAGSPNSSVSIDSKGTATGVSLGSSNVTATMGNVVGALNLIVNTNGFSSSTIATIVVPWKNKTIDVAYVPKSLNQVQGSYRVEEVNLDADQFDGGLLPVPSSLIASVALPTGFVPNVAVADPNGMRIAVFSYSSPDIQVIDASNLPVQDPLSNTVTATYTSPVKKTVTFGKLTCMICAGVVDPQTGLLLLSTAEGYYTMDLGAGTFAPLAFTPPAFPAPSFTINPTPAPPAGSTVAIDPYIISPTFGQDPNNASEVQVLDLAQSTSTTNTNFGLITPSGSAFDLIGTFGLVVDGAANTQTIVDFTNPQSPIPTTVPSIATCTGTSTPSVLGMVSIGIPATAQLTNSTPVVYLSQVSGSCLGLEVWNSGTLAQTLMTIGYGYGTLPSTPDGKQFVNGQDNNAITTFSSVVDKNNYAVLEGANQNWVFKINGPGLLSDSGLSETTPLPLGQNLQPYFVADQVPLGGKTPAIFSLPIPDTLAITSLTNLPFGNVPVGSPGLSLSFTLTNIDANINSTAFLSISQISIQGANAGDFTENDNCSGTLNPQSSCTINVIFTPKATGARSAALAITDDGGESPQMVTLSGTGT